MSKGKTFFDFSPLLKCRVILLITTLMNLGCHSEKPAGITATRFFSGIIDQAEHRIDSGKIEAGIRFLNSQYRSDKNLSVEDSFNYYMLLYNTYNRHYKNYPKAMAYSDSMILVLERNHATDVLQSAYAVAHYLKGDIYFISGDYQNAYQQYYQGKSSGRSSLDNCTLSNYNYRLGIVLYRQKQYAEAAVYFKQCYELLRNCNSSFTYVYRTQEVLTNIGLSYFNLGSTDSAEHYYNMALDFLEKSRPDFPAYNKGLYSVAKGVIYGNLGSVFYKKGDFKKAENLFKLSIEQTMPKTNAIGNDINDAQLTMLKLARLYHARNENRSMMQVLQRIRSIQDTLPDKIIEREWNLMMSKFYANENPGLAYHYLERSSTLRDSMDRQAATLQESDIREKLKNIEKEYTIIDLQRKNEMDRIYLGLAVLAAMVCILAVVSAYYNLNRTRKYMNMLGELNSRIKEQKGQLEITLKELEESHKEKDQILRVVAHDLRSPVAAVYALADMMLNEPVASSEQKENLELIKTASDHSLKLSKEILDAGVMMQSNELKTEDLDVQGYFNSLIELLRFPAAEKKQRIELDLPERQITIKADPDKLGRVINNLVTNAIKFSNEGSLIIVKVWQEDHKLIFSVKDQGIGIPDKAKTKVFDMFTEAKRYGTTGEKPFGLGLSISRQIVHAHNGTIWFESTEDLGTSFYVSLPQ